MLPGLKYDHLLIQKPKNYGLWVDLRCQEAAVNIARHFEKSARIHPQTMQNQCKSAEPLDFNGFSQNALRCWQPCLGTSNRLLTRIFFVLSQVNDHIRSQEASLCRNFVPTHRFQTGIVFSSRIFFHQIHELCLPHTHGWPHEEAIQKKLPGDRLLAKMTIFNAASVFFLAEWSSWP